MTFQQLYYLLEVEKTGSFSQAAKNLFVTQSTISNAVSSLEKEIGSPIFIRGKKKMELSPVGEDVLAHAKRICESHRYITKGERPKASMVRIGSVGFHPVYSAFERLVEENRDRQDICFALHDGRNRNFAEDLLAYRLDIAVAKFLTPTQAKNVAKLKKMGLAFEKMITVPAVVCIGPGHRLYDVGDFPMEALRGDPTIELGGLPVSRSDAIKAYLPVDTDRVIITSHSPVRKRLLLSGAGYTVTHMPPIEERGESKLRYIPIPGLFYNFYAFYDPLHPMIPEVARFLALLKEELSASTF